MNQLLTWNFGRDSDLNLLWQQPNDLLFILSTPVCNEEFPKTIQLISFLTILLFGMEELFFF